MRAILLKYLRNTLAVIPDQTQSRRGNPTTWLIMPMASQPPKGYALVGTRLLCRLVPTISLSGLLNILREQIVLPPFHDDLIAWMRAHNKACAGTFVINDDEVQRRRLLDREYAELRRNELKARQIVF